MSEKPRYTIPSSVFYNFAKQFGRATDYLDRVYKLPRKKTIARALKTSETWQLYKKVIKATIVILNADWNLFKGDQKAFKMKLKNSLKAMKHLRASPRLKNVLEYVRDANKWTEQQRENITDHWKFLKKRLDNQ